MNTGFKHVYQCAWHRWHAQSSRWISSSSWEDTVFSKTSSSPLLSILLTKSSARARVGDLQRFQILPFPADVMAIRKILHVPLSFANNFATNDSCLQINDIIFQVFLLLINYVPMLLGGKYMSREKSLSATIITTTSANYQADYDKKSSFIEQRWWT